MQIKRLTLIERIEAEIKRRQAAHGASVGESLRSFEAKREAHVLRQAKGWADFIDHIQMRLNAKQPVLRSDVPAALMETERYNGSKIDWWEGSPPSWSDAKLGDLPALLDLLKSATDDTVSTAELQRLGFKVPALFTKTN